MLPLKPSFGIFPTQQSKADLIEENPDIIGYSADESLNLVTILG